MTRGRRGRTGSWIEEEWREEKGTGLGEGGTGREDAPEGRRRRGRRRPEEELVQWEDGETTGPVWMEATREEEEEKEEDMGWMERRETEEVIWWETLKKETQARPGKLVTEEEAVRWRRRREDRKQVRRKQRHQEVGMFSPLEGKFPLRGRKDETQREQEGRRWRVEVTECRRRPPPPLCRRPWWEAIEQLRRTLALYCATAVWVWLEGDEEEEEQLFVLLVLGSDGRSTAGSIYPEPCS